MSRLHGAQRMVLRAIFDLPKDSAGYVSDSQIKDRTQIAIEEVQEWLETLKEDGYVEIAHTQAGLSALITAQGRLAVSQPQPSEPPPSGTVGRIDLSGTWEYLCKGINTQLEYGGICDIRCADKSSVKLLGHRLWVKDFMPGPASPIVILNPPLGGKVTTA